MDQLVTEATRTGLSERQYRSEIRRQVLEAKLINVRLQGRIRITEDDIVREYRRLVSEERYKLAFRAAWIRIDAARGATTAELNTKRRLADRIAEQAKAGGDFAELAQRFSDDMATRSTGGLLGRLKPGRLPKLIDRIIGNLEPGETSSPVRLGNAYYILKLLEREESELPTFENSRSELQERLYLEKVNKARRHWLDSLRRRTHVDIRL